jgi:hypothetical protein
VIVTTTTTTTPTPAPAAPAPAPATTKRQNIFQKKYRVDTAVLVVLGDVVLDSNTLFVY